MVFVKNWLNTILIPLSIVLTRISAAAPINSPPPINATFIRVITVIGNLRVYYIITLRTLLNLGQNVITFKTFLHLGLLQGQEAPDGINPFGKILIFLLFELLVFIAYKSVFSF